MKPILYSIISWALLTLLVGCSVRRPATTATQPIGGVSISQSSPLGSIRQNTRQESAFRFSSNSSIRAGEINLGSRVDWDVTPGQGIFLSLRPVVFVEAARGYLTPSSVELYDLMGKRKVEVSYDDLSRELGIRVDYPLLESFLLGQIIAESASSKFSLQSQDQDQDIRQVHSLRLDGAEILYQISDLCIDHTLFSSPKKEDLIEISYSRDKSRPMPSSQTVWKRKGKNKATLDIQIESYRSISLEESRLNSRPRGSYSTISLQELKNLFQ